MKRTLIAASLVLPLLFPHFAAAWNDTGHMTIALIAYRQLDQSQRQQVAQILKAHPHYQIYLSANRPDGVSEDEWAFVRAAAWPDFVRPSRPGASTNPELFKGPEITRYHQGPWHYMDIPFVPPGDRKAINPTTLPAENGPNILTAIEQNEKGLAAKGGKPEDRAVALAWVEHLIGDIHQPLHATMEISTAFPAGDKGGNAQAVMANGMVINLHAYWDDALGTSDGYAAIDFLASEITDDPALAPGKLTEFQQHKQPKEWAEESYRYATALVYLNGRLRSARYDAYAAREITPDQVPPLPPSYAGNARDLSKRRAATAGYRLAAEIKTALTGG